MTKKRVLIANRGEIALRIIRSVKELDMEAIAVYSDVDADSLHVKRADEAYYLGGSLPSESYRNIKTNHGHKSRYGSSWIWIPG